MIYDNEPGIVNDIYVILTFIFTSSIVVHVLLTSVDVVHTVRAVHETEIRVDLLVDPLEVLVLSHRLLSGHLALVLLLLRVVLHVLPQAARVRVALRAARHLAPVRFLKHQSYK